MAAIKHYNIDNIDNLSQNLKYLKVHDIVPTNTAEVLEKKWKSLS